MKESNMRLLFFNILNMKTIFSLHVVIWKKKKNIQQNFKILKTFVYWLK